MKDLRQYAGLCAELEKELSQAMAAARVISFCVKTGQPNPMKRSAIELNKALNTSIDLMLEITKRLNEEQVL